MTGDSAQQQLITLKVSGDYAKFKDLLRSRLYECGWVDQIKMLCRDADKNPENRDATVNELFNIVAKQGRGMVPASVKRELLVKVKELLLHSAGYYED